MTAMIDELPNKLGFTLLDRLNKKIQRYNQLSEKNSTRINAENPIEECETLHLLEEIYYMGESLRRLSIEKRRSSTYCDETKILDVINQWRGITDELMKYDDSPGWTGLSAEIKLTTLTKSGNAYAILPVISDWSPIGLINKIFWKLFSVHSQDIIPALARLHEQRIKANDSEENKLQLFRQLKRFKHLLLRKINFELDSREDINTFRKLIRTVNQEIVNLYNSLDILISESNAQKEYASYPFAQALEKNTFKANAILSQLFKEKHSTAQNILDSFKALEGHTLKCLDGNNNRHWLLTDNKTGKKFVIRGEEPEGNQAYLYSLLDTPLKKFFIHEYSATCSTSEMPYSIVVSDFAENSDLYSERVKKFADADDNQITSLAIDRIGQLVDFCHLLTQHRGMHTDIKLSNFLVDAIERVCISDKKCIVETGPKNTLKRRDIESYTDAFFPPECNCPRSQAINTEAYMTYQLGLALYNFLVLPKENHVPGERLWSEEKPLDFNKPYFDTSPGKEMAALIRSMTDDNPEQRPILSKVQQAFSDIQSTLSVISVQTTWNLTNMSILNPS